ncbi:MAG: aquaporin Z [Candidatus Micrarchaeota archaeon]|nr:aquaporin Z [Candidatus Micrarchaeota archaeon]
MNLNNLEKYAAELIGTFVLVLIGCGSAVIAGSYIGFLGIALAFGFAVLVMVYAIGNISGCHINPAITLAMLVAGKIKLDDAIGYVISQCIGAILASLVLFLILSGNPGYSLAVNGLGQNGYGPDYLGGYSIISAFITEVVMTMIFLLVIFGATSKGAPAGFAGIAIGIALVIIHLVSIPITGTSVNPARSLGPALIAGGQALAQLPLFIIAPCIGGVLAALIWAFVLDRK